MGRLHPKVGSLLGRRHVGRASSLPVRAASLPPSVLQARMPAEPAARMATLEPHGPWVASFRFCARIGTMNRCASQRCGPDRGSATRSLHGPWVAISAASCVLERASNGFVPFFIAHRWLWSRSLISDSSKTSSHELSREFCQTCIFTSIFFRTPRAGRGQLEPPPCRWSIPSPHDAGVGEGKGEGIPISQFDGTCPSPQPSPRSCLAGRGSGRLPPWW